MHDDVHDQVLVASKLLGCYIKQARFSFGADVLRNGRWRVEMVMEVMGGG